MNFATELREGLLFSWSAIRANKLRSCLTTLGIITVIDRPKPSLFQT